MSKTLNEVLDPRGDGTVLPGDPAQQLHDLAVALQGKVITAWVDEDGLVVVGERL